MTFPTEWENNPFMFQTTNQISDLWGINGRLMGYERNASNSWGINTEYTMR